MIDAMSMVGAWGVLMLAVVISVLGIVGLWKVLHKAGMPGWVSLIPIYNVWAWGVAVFSNRKKSVVWVLATLVYVLVVITAGGKIFTYDSSALGSGLSSSSSVIVQLGFLSFVWMIVQAILLVMQLLASISTARAFGKSMGFAAGLFFLTPLFLFALGLSSASYLGADGSYNAPIQATASIPRQPDFGPGTTQEMPRQP